MDETFFVVFFPLRQFEVRFHNLKPKYILCKDRIPFRSQIEDLVGKGACCQA